MRGPGATQRRLDLEPDDGAQLIRALMNRAGRAGRRAAPHHYANPAVQTSSTAAPASTPLAGMPRSDPSSAPEAPLPGPLRCGASPPRTSRSRLRARSRARCASTRPESTRVPPLAGGLGLRRAGLSVRSAGDRRGGVAQLFSSGSVGGRRRRTPQPGTRQAPTPRPGLRRQQRGRGRHSLQRAGVKRTAQLCAQATRRWRRRSARGRWTSGPELQADLNRGSLAKHTPGMSATSSPGIRRLPPTAGAQNGAGGSREDCSSIRKPRPSIR
jgi:hypothetical protein